jgi:hypothetical protein
METNSSTAPAPPSPRRWRLSQRFFMIFESESVGRGPLGGVTHMWIESAGCSLRIRRFPGGGFGFPTSTPDSGAAKMRESLRLGPGHKGFRSQPPSLEWAAAISR